MAGLVQRREQRFPDVVRTDAGRDAHVARRELRAERMMSLVEPPALEVIAHPLGHADAEIELRRFAENAAQTVVVRRRLLGYRAHHRNQLFPELRKERPDRGGRHAFVGGVDQRIGHMLVGCEKIGILATEVERLFQERQHRREVVRGSRPRPGIEGGRAERVGARDMIGRHFDRLLEVASGNADQARVVGVVRQAVGIGRKLVEQSAQRRVDRFFMRQPAQGRTLATPRRSPACRHVGRLVPVEQGAGCARDR